MMEFLDLSVPVGGSGKFIRLHQTGALLRVQPLWAKYCRLQKRLEGVKAELRLCNEPAWLFQFAKRSQRQDKDFEKQLRRHVDELEKTKDVLEKQSKEIYSKLGEVDPSLLEVSHTLAGTRMLHAYGASYFGAQKSAPAVLRRNAIIEKYPHSPSVELCKRFDVEEIPLSEKWTKEFPEIHFWATAYNNPIRSQSFAERLWVCSGTARLLQPS